jgi:hypothetical protein
MNMDKGIHSVGHEDGYLEREELSFYLQDLSKLRESRALAGQPTDFVDMRINDGRKLYKDMTENDFGKLKYLPDEVLALVSGVRQRACELLRRDDPSGLGEIDQYCIDHARARYEQMNPSSSVGLNAKTSALEEISKLAVALGLS